ncbi:mediator of RNA polymerase II transcription subunit 1-domain-containing protein [Daldinia caldariorum]|uniref:mediator of RNA polymerase II transcription subunit 1-domain-containing protein n=1 Tax=Daldinia caldariorum TaxID=326644 RepID=UPI00200822AC|nr:mediator of RNA polymerase II transcription subunit 1-domain-containing protein [Daldinia caldariorum]KAI1465909.1 mediator of RNA polymerase II transcription subunit 1-domain-containing protein [Daldinia caldariorum]
MSTPMRHGPSQQGRTPSQHPAAAPTPQASTPFSNPQTAAVFSPRGPKSSPQQFKKSPATGTSGTMIGTTSSTANFDSPSAAAAYNTLGMTINDLNLDNISVGGLVAAAGRTDEEDRKKRMEAVIAALWAQNSSRVSNQGLERLAIHLNLECLWEDIKGAGENAKTLIIAGQTVAVEVGITNHIVHQAALAYTDSIPSVDKHVDKASAILLKDLSLAPGQSPLTKRLTQFRANLERLANLDKLSVSPGLNCHEAIAGIWESLDRLHQWDVQKLREDSSLSDISDENLRVYALCLRHGCPLMHTRGRVGLSFDYWKERRKLKSTTVDTEDAKTWGILIECAAAGGMVYHNPIRVSDKWIGDGIEKSNLTDEEMISSTGPVLDWLEPPNTLLPSSEETKEHGLEAGVNLSGPKPPDVVFMATFDPPVVVSHAVAIDIYKISATNAPLSHITFDALLFPIVDGSSYDPSEPREVVFTQTVPTFIGNIHNKSQSEPVLKAHRNTLFIYKPVYGQVLSQIPFSHPKDLVVMLPVLRQYAFLSLLLTNSLKLRNGKPTAKEADEDNDARLPRTRQDEFSDFMAQPNEDTTSDKVLKVDITLTAHPIPRLALVFPFKDHTAHVNIEIQHGGRVRIVSDNIFDGDMGHIGGDPLNRKRVKSDWENALETLEDLGAWIEVIKDTLE